MAHIGAAAGLVALQGCGFVNLVGSQMPVPDVVRNDVIVHENIAYDIHYEKYGAWEDQQRYRDGLLFDETVADPDVVYVRAVGADAGASRITVARGDGVLMTRDDEALARRVALKACAINSEWEHQSAFGEGTVIDEGRFTFMGICK